MPEDAVMDTAVDTALDAEPVDTGAEPVSEPDPAGAEPVAEPGAPAVAEPAKLIDGGKLTAEAKATIDKIKAENPALGNQLQRALFKNAEIERALPGGLKELNTLRQTVETLGGEHGIQELQTEVNGFRQFDEQFTAGDPKAIEFMTSDPSGQEAFVKLMPSALGKFLELHPSGYSQYMAQVFSGDLSNAGIPLALMRIADFLGDNAQAKEQWQKISDYVNRVGQLASQQVDNPKFAKAAPDNRAGELDQREATLTRNEWKTESSGEQRSVFESEWNRLAAGRKLSDAQTAAVKELFESRLNKAVNGKHQETLERYFSAKDKAGFLRYASSINKTELPKALREAFDAVIPAKPGPRPGSAPAPKPTNGKPANGMPIAQGFVQVAQRPSTAEIDMRNPFNNPKNFLDGKAILKGGKRVQWAR